ncbi:MAG: hypothetical protein SGI72_12470 [Planctomycetota bacterium]|nr:hypothetical protein [Planctomycetota bacterium]
MSQRFGLAGFAALTLSACSMPAMYITPRVSRLDIEGDVGIQQGSTLTAVASVDSLGIEEDTSVPGGRVDLLGPGHWTFSAQQSSHDGDGIADATLSSDSVTINVGDPVRSEFEFGLYSGAVTFDLVPGDTIEVGIGLGVALLDIDASFTDLLTSQVVATDEIVPVPNIAARVGVNVGPFEFSGLINWIKVDYRDTEASFLDVDTMGRLRIFGDSDRFAGHVALGYRFLNVQAEYESDGNSIDVDVDFDGPWIGLSVSF